MNANSNEIIKDALAVRDDGAQPRFEAHEYEQVLLILARGDEGLAEDGIAHALARIAAGTNDEANALIFAADRKRDAEAAASVGKSAGAPPSAVADDAQQVRKSGSSPRYTRDDYHAEMSALSKKLARPGESPCGAYSRLVGEGVFDDLYAAAELAEERERAEAVSKAAPEDRFYPLLVRLAHLHKRSGESIEQAASRLLHEDETVKAAYAAVNGG